MANDRKLFSVDAYFFYPWRAIEDLQSNGSFCAKLETNLLCLPPQKKAEIDRAKRRITVNQSVGDTLVGVGIESSPTETRENEVIDAAIDAMGLYENIIVDADNEVENDTNEIQWNELNTRILEGYDWSSNYDEVLELALTNYKNEYYENIRNEILLNSSRNDTLQLFDTDMFKPENARTTEQRFIIYHHLYHLYSWKQYLESNDPECVPPLQSYTLIEGLPGTGKTFVIKTLRNMTRLIFRNNNADMASAPTGCAASLFNGSTHNHCCDIPTGKAFQKYPTNIKQSDITKIKSMTKTMRNIICRIFYEHSMTGRSMFGWLKHRDEKF